MKKYKLIALNCTAKGNRVLRKEDNETYTEDAWDEGVADKLVKDGFLEVVGKKDKKEQAKEDDKTYTKDEFNKAVAETKEKEAAEKAAIEAKQKEEEEKAASEAKDKEQEEKEAAELKEKEDIPAYEDVSGKQMRAQLIAQGEEVKSNEPKKSLYKRLYGIDA